MINQIDLFGSNNLEDSEIVEKINDFLVDFIGWVCHNLLVVDMNNKFHKSAEIKKNLTQTKITQMKEAAIKAVKDTSIKIAVNSVKKIITTSVDKSKLDNLFKKNLEETKSELKKINL